MTLYHQFYISFYKQTALLQKTCKYEHLLSILLDNNVNLKNAVVILKLGLSGYFIYGDYMNLEYSVHLITNYYIFVNNFLKIILNAKITATVSFDVHVCLKGILTTIVHLQNNNLICSFLC